MQERLEEVSFLMRIPQRKPWGNIASEIAASRAGMVAARAGMLAQVRPAQAEQGEELLDLVAAKLQAVSLAVAAQDADRTSVRLADALDALAQLEVLQAPGLPFALPAQYAGRASLQGRAEVDLVFARAGGALFAPLSDGAGAQRTATVTITLDGYNAPLTAGNFVEKVPCPAWMSDFWAESLSFCRASSVC